MKTTIEVGSKQEAELIKAGLADPLTRALVQVVGALAPLSQKAKKRALEYVADRLEEERNGEKPE